MLRFVGDVEPYELGKMITIHDLGFEDSELFAIRLPGIFVVVSHGCTSSVSFVSYTVLGSPRGWKVEAMDWLQIGVYVKV